MSSIAFHTPTSTVLVGGAERAHMGYLCDRLMFGILELEYFPDRKGSNFSRLMKMVSSGCYLHELSVERQVLAMPAAISHGHNTLTWNGHQINAFELALNTALVLGSDPVKLSARIHGTCEIHGWIAGKNRNWLANIIEEGQASGVIREAFQTQYGNWPEVVSMLRCTKLAPVVMSYSVCDSFPEDTDRNFDQAFEELRVSSPGLEISPKTWKTHRFGEGLTAIDLTASDWKSRLDRLFPKES